MTYKVKDVTGFEYLLVSCRKPCLGTTSPATPGSNIHPGAGSAQCLEISLGSQCTEPGQRLSALSTPRLWPSDSTHIRHLASRSINALRKSTYPQPTGEHESQHSQEHPLTAGMRAREQASRPGEHTVGCALESARRTPAPAQLRTRHWPPLPTPCFLGLLSGPCHRLYFSGGGGTQTKDCLEW